MEKPFFTNDIKFKIHKRKVDTFLNIKINSTKPRKIKSKLHTWIKIPRIYRQESNFLYIYIHIYIYNSVIKKICNMCTTYYTMLCTSLYIYYTMMRTTSFIGTLLTLAKVLETYSSEELVT